MKNTDFSLPPTDGKTEPRMLVPRRDFRALTALPEPSAPEWPSRQHGFPRGLSPGLPRVLCQG